MPADPIEIDAALSALRAARMLLFLAARARIEAMARPQLPSPELVAEMNDAIAEARATWRSARSAAAALLEAP